MNVLAPTDMVELFSALAEPGARVLAGGTDLLVRLRSGRESAGVLVSLHKLPQFATVELRDGGQPKGELALGAGCTHAQLLADAQVRAHLPGLCAALCQLGSPPIRNMGTLGGNLCTASPAGDCLPPLYALGAEVELASAAGTRRLPLKDFILGPGRTALAEGELMTRVIVPLPAPGVLQHFEKVGRRDALAISVVSLAAALRLGPGRKVLSARLAWGSVGPTVWQCPEAEGALTGRRLGLTALKQAAAMVRESVRPMDDLRAGADYRREVAGNLLLRLASL